MEENHLQLQAHASPPPSIKAVFKRWQRAGTDELASSSDILDLAKHQSVVSLRVQRKLSPVSLSRSFSSFCGTAVKAETECTVFSHDSLPGLHIIHNLIPIHVQKHLLSRLLHQELSDPVHKTNVHTHYDLRYEAVNDSSTSTETSTVSGSGDTTMNRFVTSKSFFNHPPSSSVHFQPHDPAVHKPLSLIKFLSKSLRWVTLGGQYDWTRKVYPSTTPPPFPIDIAQLLAALTADAASPVIPQAAICNLYSPGDTLSLHRDVSEPNPSHPLVSISIGCSCIFVIGIGDIEDEKDGEAKSLVLRLHSGDALLMRGPARLAWHGVPRVEASTCPVSLADWPADDQHIQADKGRKEGALDAGYTANFELWRGWMAGKRVNLNVRQMFGD